ncbi:MAG: hypothetical protein JO009_06015 [Candidatus Eremiobacteraeota bacterium]|nr:hypothetical protein [Candidatus Eremiobacteraeota bacterium]
MTFLTTDLHRGMVSLWNMGETKIGNFELCRFIGASTRIVEEEEHCVITAPLCGVAIRSRKQCIHFRLFQVSDRDLRRPLEWNTPNVSTPFNMFGRTFGDKTRQCVNRCKTLIAGRHTAPARIL